MNWYRTLKIASNALLDVLTHPEEHKEDPKLESFQINLAEILKRNNKKVGINDEDLENALSDNPFKTIFIKRNKIGKWDSGINFMGKKYISCINERNIVDSFKCALVKAVNFVPKNILDCILNPNDCYEEILGPAFHSDIY